MDKDNFDNETPENQENNSKSDGTNDVQSELHALQDSSPGSAHDINEFDNFLQSLLQSDGTKPLSDLDENIGTIVKDSDGTDTPVNAEIAESQKPESKPEQDSTEPNPFPSWEELISQTPGYENRPSNVAPFQEEPSTGETGIKLFAAPFYAEDHNNEKTNRTENGTTTKENEQFPEPQQPSIPNVKSDLNWQESDDRLQALQEILGNSPGEKKPRLSIFDQLKKDFTQSPPLVQGASIFAVLVIVIFLIFVGVRFIPSSFDNGVTSANTPLIQSSDQLPFPTSIQFPGGWLIHLNQGSLQDGAWKPADAEWLRGTEICRLISIPWSKQVDSVYQTFSTGDEFMLTMSNNDLLSYKFEEKQTSDLNQINQLINRNSPCLVIILMKPEAVSYQVVVAAPNFGNLPVTATISANQPVNPDSTSFPTLQSTGTP